MRRGDDPVIVALDVNEWSRATHLLDSLQGKVETIKVGLEAYTCLGAAILDELRARDFRVFADLKLHDIPNTVQGAVRGLVRRGVDMLTVHTLGGRDMLQAAAYAAREESSASGSSPAAVLGVTVLTSLDRTSLEEMGLDIGVEELVMSLARLGIGSGLDGVVSSAREAKRLRLELGEEAIIVTPGIRLPSAEIQDQARVVGPAEALKAGADYLVVGRMIVDDPHPESALKRLREAAVI
jgi:orotidine-5'-phosphate decarboxylase